MLYGQLKVLDALKRIRGLCRVALVVIEPSVLTLASSCLEGI